VLIAKLPWVRTLSDENVTLVEPKITNTVNDLALHTGQNKRKLTDNESGTTDVVGNHGKQMRRRISPYQTDTSHRFI
jgi:hypothetical protein